MEFGQNDDYTPEDIFHIPSNPTNIKNDKIEKIKTIYD